MDLGLKGRIALITGGSRGKTHMVYLSGMADHKIEDDNVVEHIVSLVEAKAAELEATAKAEAALQPALASH